jgi:hypothetical protein
MVAVVALSMLVARLAGGRLRTLLELRLRAVGLLWTALALQLVLLAVPGPPSGWRTGIYVASYPLGLGFAWANRHVTGVVVAAAGAALNLVAIVANGGVMPASKGALETAGLAVDLGVWTNSTALADPRLPFLGDVFAVPRGWPFATVFSVGDLIIVVGAAIAVQAITGSRLVPERWRLRTA